MHLSIGLFGTIFEVAFDGSGLSTYLGPPPKEPTLEEAVQQAIALGGNFELQGDDEDEGECEEPEVKKQFKPGFGQKGMF